MMKFIKDENGQGMLEYVLIIALVALVLVVILIAVRRTANNAGDKTNDQLEQVNKELNGSSDQG